MKGLDAKGNGETSLLVDGVARDRGPVSGLQRRFHQTGRPGEYRSCRAEHGHWQAACAIRTCPVSDERGHARSRRAAGRSPAHPSPLASHGAHSPCDRRAFTGRRAAISNLAAGICACRNNPAHAGAVRNN